MCLAKPKPIRGKPHAILLLILVMLIGCSPSKDLGKKSQPEPAPEVTATRIRFQNTTASAYLDHAYENGEDTEEHSILETIGGGAGAVDYDRDGFVDLVMTSGGKLEGKEVSGLGAVLMRSNLDRNFKEVSIQAGVDCGKIYTHGVTSGDLNSDGFPDVLITGYYGLALFINQGDGTFVEVSAESGMVEPSWGTSAAMADVDNDGNLDIYIAHYVDWSFKKHPPCQSSGKPDVCAPGIFTGLSDVLYRNQGDGKFLAASSQFGLQPEGKGLGVLAADFNGDSKIDIYVANDTTNNFFYLNREGVLEEIGLANGTAVDDMGTPSGSMGLCTLDFDSDLRADIWVCNYENQAFGLYQNDGEANFRYATTSAGLMALGTSAVAWGTAAQDYDLDGDEDIVVSNGHVMRSNPPEQLPILLTNLNNQKFQLQTDDPSSYFSHKWRGRGVVAWDFENDGDMDLLVTHIKSNVALLRNETQTSGQWWMIDLVGVKSNRDAIGARVIIESNKRKLLRNVVGGGSYLSQSAYAIHWGLPADEKLVKVTVYWPSGQVNEITSLLPNSRKLVVESQN